MDDVLLSTSDNPFNPWTQWEAWWAWDAQAGYHTPAYLARIIVTSDELSEADQVVAYNDAVDEIIREHDNDFYVRVPNPA